MHEKELKVLVIDSHPQTATSISTILGNEGYITEEAYNSKRAQDALKSDGFSLIIVDADVELGAINDSKHPKIIVTGFDMPKDKLKKFKNVLGVLTKPISREELLKLVKKIA